MIFIYGSGAFLEKIHDLIREKNIIIRGGLWVVLILSIELITGFLLQKLIGVCPWDYTGSSPYALFGLIRIDYIPYWFVLGLIFEKIHDFLDAFMGKLKMTLD
ncbi:MAG: putative ABC transporter permease [Senegalia sp. (in: firmicutes)]|uniref:putative ABC transporter permease n=1 Tax=Senegalia sp. (in: firmicutes) TaxID=1924098 RepID=UPI003F95AA07